MYIDFHTHGKLAKKLPFSKEYTHWLFSEAKNAGLDALCLTEHFNTHGFGELYNYIMENSERDRDTLIFEGMRIFPGMEIDIAEGGHILIIGSVEAVLELNHLLEPHKVDGSFLTLEELMDLCEQYPVIAGGAHPYRGKSNIPTLPRKQLERLHFFDLNGKDVAENKELTQRYTSRLGISLGKPVVGGSDTHQAVQYGCIRTEFDTTFRTVADLYDEMLKGRFKIHTAKHLNFQVKSAWLIKKALKEIHALGGDYVSVLLEKNCIGMDSQVSKVV